MIVLNETVISVVQDIYQSTVEEKPQEIVIRKGDGVTPAEIGALSVSRRLSEFVTEQMKLEARLNLDVQIVNGGSF